VLCAQLPRPATKSASLEPKPFLSCSTFHNAQLYLLVQAGFERGRDDSNSDSRKGRAADNSVGEVADSFGVGNRNVKWPFWEGETTFLGES
jgi:hypothetical protein